MPTYAAPGVYVEEVVVTQKVLSAAPTAVAAFVGFTEQRPDRRPERPRGPGAAAGHQLDPVREPLRQLHSGLRAAAVGVRLLRQRRSARLHRAGSRTPSRPASRRAASCRPPTARSACRSPSRASSRTPTSPSQVSTDDDGDDEDGPSPFTLDVLSRAATSVESFAGPDPGQGQAQRRDRRQQDLDQDQGRASRWTTRRDLSSQLEVLKPGLYPLEKAAPDTGSGHRPQVRRLGVGPQRHQRPGRRRRRHHGRSCPTWSPPPPRRTARSTSDLWKAVQTALISHCEQNGNRMAVLDAPPGMTPQQIKEWRSDVAMYDSAYAALYYPWIKVENPIGVNGDAEVLIPPSGPHRRRLGPHRRDPRRVEGAGQRHHPRLPRRRVRRHPERAGACSTRSASTASARSAPAASGSGAPAPWPATPTGATSTSAGCSTWSRRRSPRAPSGPCSSRTTCRLWEGVKRTLNAFLRGLWSAGALFGAVASTRRSTSSATPRPTRRSRSTRACSIVEVGIAPVKPAEFVVFRIAQQKQIAS